jgi:hypothetical protein
MQGQFTIQFDSMEELRQELAHLLGNLPVQAVPVPATAIAAVREAVTGLIGGGPVVHPPEARQRMNEAAAKAQEALVQQRSNGSNGGKPAEAVKPVETAARKRGRPARITPPAGSDVSTHATQPAPQPSTEPGEDLAGDPEEGDHSHTPDEEPNDPIVGQADVTKTPGELRSALLPVLMEVHKKDKAAVPALCAKFHAPRVSLIDDKHIDQLWEDSMVLCRKHGVPFVGEDPSAGDAML